MKTSNENMHCQTSRIGHLVGVVRHRPSERDAYSSCDDAYEFQTTKFRPWAFFIEIAFLEASMVISVFIESVVRTIKLRRLHHDS